MKHCQRLLAATVLLAALPALAQTSVGYEDPDELDALLAYRLPDWGWSDWTGHFRLQGAGEDRRTVSNRHILDLDTRRSWFREGERTSWDLDADARTYWSVDNRSTSDREYDSDRFESSAGVEGTTRRYLGDAPVYVLGNARLEWRYSQFDQTTQRDGEPDDRISKGYARSLSMRAGTGLGVGRVRNVTPLIQAQRVSERLVALGRPALSRRQTVELAQVLVRRGGYANVYDRYQRHFWQAALEPVLDPARPLSPYELEYLEDVLNEQLLDRRQGARVEISGGWQEDRDNRDSFSDDLGNEQNLVAHGWTASLDALWAHNLSLTTQVSLSARLDGARLYTADYQHDEGWATLAAAWQRDVADRHRISVTLETQGYFEEYVDGPLTRRLDTTLDLADRIYVEDSFYLLPYARVTYTGVSSTDWDPVEPGFDWVYGFSAGYTFDSGVF